MGCRQSAPVAQDEHTEPKQIMSDSSVAKMPSSPRDKFVESVPEAVKRFTVQLWLTNATQTLRTIISQPEARRFLSEFLAHEYAEQNLNFFVACQRFHDMHSSGMSSDALNKELAQIFSTYLELGSSQEVNVSSTVRELAARGDPVSFLQALTHAQEEILRMMSLDCFPRFLKSPYMEQLQTSLVKRHTAAQERDTASELMSFLKKAQDNLDDARKRRSAVASPRADLEVDGLVGTGSTWLDAFIAVADLMPTCIVLSDMQQRDYPMVYVNKAFCDVTGYSREESVGRNCRFIQGQGTQEAVVAKIRRALRTGAEHHCEILNYKKNGQAFRNFLSLRPVWQEVSDAEWEELVAAQALSGGSYIEGRAMAEGSVIFNSTILQGSQTDLSNVHSTAAPASESAASSDRPAVHSSEGGSSLMGVHGRRPGPILMRILPADPTAEPSAGTSSKSEEGTSSSPASGRPSQSSFMFHDRVSAWLRGRKARLAYFIGVQFEIDDEHLVPQRLVQHNALLQQLPLTVGF